jgi:hypothetical protein
MLLLNEFRDLAADYPYISGVITVYEVITLSRSFFQIILGIQNFRKFPQFGFLARILFLTSI